jgi:hypothetical protein
MVLDFREGLITRWLIIQDLSAVVDAYMTPVERFLRSGRSREAVSW